MRAMSYYPAAVAAPAATCRVHIPEINHALTSPRVLTMEFIEGVPVTDLSALQRLRISPAALSRLISETFSEMIFIHGDVHADPHAANMLVRKKVGTHCH
jgi:aarF domain-containing kinase